MTARLTGIVLVLVLGLAAAAPAAAGPIALAEFGLGFTASQSLWRGGPSAGLDEQHRTGGSVGLYYDVRANTGTVNAVQNGTLAASFMTETTLGSLTTIGLQFAGAPGGRVQSLFGASAEAGVFLDISGCFGVQTTFGCVGQTYNIDTDIAVIDEGFFLSPTTTHTPVIDTLRSATQADNVTGVGAGPSFLGFQLGPSMNLDLEQRISFTPTGLSGLACYENVSTFETGCSPFSVPTSGVSQLNLALGLGTWNVSFLDVSLLNSFRNDIDLEIRPSFSYVVGEWPPVGQELFAFGLLDETFSLNFTEVSRAGMITVSVVPTPVPEPASLALLGSGLLAVSWQVRRRHRRA